MIDRTVRTYQLLGLRAEAYGQNLFLLKRYKCRYSGARHGTHQMTNSSRQNDGDDFRNVSKYGLRLPLSSTNRLCTFTFFSQSTLIGSQMRALDDAIAL